jgi:hypothetical protein
MHGPLSALFGNIMKAIKYIVSIAALTAALTFSAQANFIPDDQDGVKMWNDVANKNVSDFEGFVGGNHPSFPHVDVHTTGNVDTGSGWSNAKPANKRTSLTQLIFTPENGNLFNGFSFRGQLNDAAGGIVTLIVQDNQGHAAQTFTFTGLGGPNDFARQGILSLDGETIKSVTLISNFKEVKQIMWTFAPGQVPDGGTTVMLLGAALSTLGMARRFFKS